jgi:hypothetical protein
MYARFQRLFLFVTFVSMLAITSCAPSIPSETSPPVATSTMSIETLRADPDYMAGCIKINPNFVDVQAGYKGIYPGRTTQDEVRNVFGKPLRIPQIAEGTLWEYEYLAVSFEKSKVSELYVFESNGATLRDFILQYGCPDEIYALDVNEHPYGEYSRLMFLYHRIGFDFTIDNIPAKLDDTAYQTTYFKPGTRDDFMNIFLSLTVPNAAKPIDWDDAVD